LDLATFLEVAMGFIDDMAMGQNSSALTNTKIDGKWMFILKKKEGIDP
jgi:hypothetical protein